MNNDKKYMAYCLSLAKKGIRDVAPNPMVGCVIVHQEKIIGTGYHQQYGKNHAEVNAINAVKNKALLTESTLYVNLEPCAHYGKTPPCADFIIKSKIPKVVVGCIDPFSEVSGKGIQKIKDAGILTVVGILEKEAIALNKRFFTFHHKKRPYIILKWAVTKDGFMDVDRTFMGNQGVQDGKKDYRRAACLEIRKDIKVDNWITSYKSKQLVHQWRSEEQAIMVGTNTAKNDNPALTVREYNGKNPLRIVLDLNLRLPQNLNLFNQKVPTIVFNYQLQEKRKHLEWVKIEKSKDVIVQVLEVLYQKEIQSLIVEGGAQLLNTFIDKNIWDESRVFTGNNYFRNGLKAPVLKQRKAKAEQIETDLLTYYFND